MLQVSHISKQISKQSHVKLDHLLWLPEAGGGGLSKLDKRNQKVQVSSYKIKKSWDVIYSRGIHSSQYCTVYLKTAKRVDIKNFHQNKKL